MILGTSEILWRLKLGQIFVDGSWKEDCIREASYALRVARDGMLVGGKVYPPGTDFEGSYVEIKPGEIAVLSTVERLRMPRDIVGHLGIRLDYAAKGLTGLMGIQVDPGYGTGKEDERLYLRVANLGSDPVSFRPGNLVFNLEFQKVAGIIKETLRDSTWERLETSLLKRPNPSWSSLTDLQDGFSREIEQVRKGLEPVVMFGVFLVAATLLGATIAVMLSFRDTPSNTVPDWITNGGWIVLAGFVGTASIVTLAVGLVTIVRAFPRTRRR